MSETPNPSGPPPPDRIAKGMVYATWILVLVMLTWGFSHWFDAQRNPNQRVSSAVVDGGTQIVLERNRYGHYNASGSINGQPVEFMLDTGATWVAIPARLADRLGLKRGHQTQVRTANGTAVAYVTNLTSVRLGEIEVRDVRAHIAPGMEGEEVLLGMSVLKNLEFTQRGNTLTLRQVPVPR